MIKHYKFFAKWRKQDVEYLRTFKTSRDVVEGYCGFYVEEKDYHKIINHYSKKDSILRRVKPPEFSFKQVFSSFSEEELKNAKYYMLATTGEPKGYPQPKDGYKCSVFTYDECTNILIDNIQKATVRINKIQKAPFSIKKPKWSKSQVNFSLNWEWDFMFFKKDFYQNVLAPLGLKYKEVLQHNTGKPLEDTVQLDIPVAESKILIEGSAYDIYEPRCGKKQYARQYLDFFPPFEKKFDFHICYTQEEFDGGFKRIIISKEFCHLLVKHNIIKYQSDQLIPMKRI